MPSSTKSLAEKMQTRIKTATAAVDFDQDEDAHLSEEQLNLEQYLHVEVVRPTGVANLRQWGQVIVPAGKHKFKSHEAIFEEDLPYAVLIARKTSLASPWALSFKNYALARLKATARATQTASMVTKVPEFQPKTQTKGKLRPKHQPGTVTVNDSGDENEDAEWGLLLEPVLDKKGYKREGQASASSNMKLEVNREEIMMRRAILERELAKLQEIEADNDNSYRKALLRRLPPQTAPPVAEEPLMEVPAAEIPGPGTVPGEGVTTPPHSEQPEMEVSPVVSETPERPPEVNAADLPVPEDDDDEDLLFGDAESFFEVLGPGRAWEINLHETQVPQESLPSPEQALHFVMLATEERKKRVEVKLRDLSAQERELFTQAKGKEVQAWLDHRTVRKVAAGSLSDEQLMRNNPTATLTEAEVKVGYLQSKVHAVSLMIVPIQENHVTFCTFSDASFASTKDNNSYQGALVVATDWRMLANESAVLVPVAWSSRKIARVVRSTLSAEVVSLCGSVDRMSWIRLFWEWIKDPSVDIAQPDDVLKRAPQASLVTDCKSAYDIATKTAVPSCTELRTQLECLLLRERLQENCLMRWVHSRAMLADCLTKVMDSSELRRRLSEGRYALFDEQQVLENRAGKRQSLKWLKDGPPQRADAHK
ncbi:hypothetical protein AK812_SmicGene7844 [Symbiodinium microadriaticum]|uniref:Uncharacterized protein n=1 Tax=Symbiodinium microadriaticum TaxID=2951 RepID=A0A1Q9EMF7_SYMMI|nr:hypothetical protein AK812_SmicGene7844 [Symbiodinium microadriaticum]